MVGKSLWFYACWGHQALGSPGEPPLNMPWHTYMWVFKCPVPEGIFCWERHEWLVSTWEGPGSCHVYFFGEKLREWMSSRLSLPRLASWHGTPVQRAMPQQRNFLPKRLHVWRVWLQHGPSYGSRPIRQPSWLWLQWLWQIFSKFCFKIYSRLGPGLDTTPLGHWLSWRGTAPFSRYENYLRGIVVAWSMRYHDHEETCAHKLWRVPTICLY